jgi:Ni/Fe-hydrogenase subunit HybB-like protein
VVTNMRDQVSWAFYIGNFTFLVGVAAAAVMLVIPAYVYNWKPIKEIAIFGELLAISAFVMCMLFVPLLMISIPAAVGIHTVTAFVYAGAAARPFWNSAILAPRFLASAFCSGPAILLILFQVLRRTTKIEIKDEAIHKIAELMAYARFLNLLCKVAIPLLQEPETAVENIQEGEPAAA